MRVWLGKLLPPQFDGIPGGIPHPHPMAIPKGEVDRGVTARDGVGNRACNLIQWNVIGAKAPDKVINVTYMLLMWLGSKKCFKHSFTTVYLTNVAKLC